MPIYEYVCKDCGHAFEHLARTLSEPKPKCPKCGARNPAKQFSAFNAAAGKNLPDTCPAEESGSRCASSCASGHCPYA